MKTIVAIFKTHSEAHTFTWKARQKIGESITCGRAKAWMSLESENKSTEEYFRTLAKRADGFKCFQDEEQRAV